MQRTLPLIALAALLLFAVGCSPFDQAWNSYKPLANLTPAQAAISGKWKGNWQSTTNGHNGALRAIITPDTTGDGDDQFTAWYQATYAGLLKFHYKMPFTLHKHETHYHANGSADLGSVYGGQYDYTAFTDGDIFEATYESDKDNGKYYLKHVK